MNISDSLPELISDSDTRFSVPYNLVSSKPSSEHQYPTWLAPIPVIDAEGEIVSIAQYESGAYTFNLPPGLAAEMRLGNYFFEFRVSLDIHDSIRSEEGTDQDTQAIMIVSVI